MSFYDVVAGMAAVPAVAIYALGLLAVALLAFRRVAGHGIPIVLSLAWFSAAVAFFPSPVDKWQSLLLPVLFAAQGLLLLIRGLVLGKHQLVMPHPAGLLRLVGGLLIGYALVVDPLLRVWKVFAASGGPTPFALVPLTLGLLLFLERVPAYLLGIPLAWAFYGGAAGLDPRTGVDLGLTASLLVGCLYLAPSRRECVNLEGDLRRETWPAYAARTRRGFGRTLLLLCLAGALLSYLAVGDMEDVAPLARWPAIHTALLAVLALGYWLWLPAWMGPAFRRLAWGLAVLLRRARAGLSWWMDLWPAWLFALVAALLVVYENHDTVRQESLNAWKFPLLVAAGVVLILGFLYVIYRARRRLVILDFIDYTGDERLKEGGKGLASRLRNQLAGLSSLYRTIDEALPAPSGSILPVTVGVEDPLESFHDAVGPDAKVQIWKFEFPIGFLVRWLGRVVGGPRMTGSLHRQGDGYLLLADYSGTGGRKASWSVDSRDLQEGPLAETEQIQALVENLSYRVVTALSSISSQRWEAVRHFTTGLRAYRNTQLATKDPAADLRAAERAFIQAMEEDGTFAQCHYNLGVVYRGLRRFESAEAAFRETLEADLEWKEAYYALANVYWDQKQYRRAALYARKAIEVLPFDARGWNLSGISRFWSAPESAAKPAQEVVEDFEIATALAWRALIRLALGKGMSRPLQVERYVASRCASNLSLVFARDSGRLAEALGASGEALHLSPRSALFRLYHGEILFDAKKLPESRTALYEAFGDALPGGEQLQRWMYLLAVQPAPAAGEVGGCARETMAVYRAFLDGVVPSEPMVLVPGDEDRAPVSQLREYRRFLAETLENLEQLKVEEPSRKYFDSWKRAIRLLGQLEEGPDPGDLAEFDQLDRDWANAQIEIRKVRAQLATKPKEAAEQLTEALRGLENTHRRQIRRQGLYTLRARACLLQAASETGKPRRALLLNALADAERSVAEEPESPARRWILAEVHGALGDVEQATQERHIALRLRQSTDFLESAETIERIAEEYLKCSRVEVPRDGVLRRGLEFLQHVLGLLEGKFLDPDDPERRFEAHAAAHYWIGRFHLEMEDWQSAVHGLRVAHSMGFQPVAVALRLGVACFGAGHFEEAGKVFRDAVRSVHAELKAASPATDLRDPIAELLLSWAMVCAEMDSRLLLACRLVAEVQKRWLPPKSEAGRRRELSALCYEGLCRIRLRQGRPGEAIAELERALRLQETSRGYALLAEALRAMGNDGTRGVSETRRRIQHATERAERLRQEGGGGAFGLWLLLEAQTGEKKNAAVPKWNGGRGD